MSHHGDEHASADAGHAHPAPGIPEVKDEAGDTPSWVPKVGILVVGAMLALIAYALLPATSASPADAPAADEKTEAATDKAE